MIIPWVADEMSPLRKVVVGIANDFGGIPEHPYDPKSKYFIEIGEFPVEKDLVAEIDGLAAILEKHGVEVLRPKNLTLEDGSGVNQIFARDIAFVIDNRICLADIHEDRQIEKEGIAHILEQIPAENTFKLPVGTKVEGGDVMPFRDKLLVGCTPSEHEFNTIETARTNQAAVDALQKEFDHREVISFDLAKSDTDPRYNALHLDCCFQPVGEEHAIIFPEGFKHQRDLDFIEKLIGKENLISITREEMYHMNANVFSISPDVLVSDKAFVRLNGLLRERGFTVEEHHYRETAKMEGLFRCSTLPLVREKS